MGGSSLTPVRRFPHSYYCYMFMIAVVDLNIKKKRMFRINNIYPDTFFFLFVHTYIERYTRFCTHSFYYVRSFLKMSILYRFFARVVTPGRTFQHLVEPINFQNRCFVFNKVIYFLRFFASELAATRALVRGTSPTIHVHTRCPRASYTCQACV